MDALTEFLVFMLLMSVFVLVSVATAKLLVDAWERGAWWMRVLFGDWDGDGGRYRLMAVSIGSGIAAMLLVGHFLAWLLGQP